MGRTERWTRRLDEHGLWMIGVASFLESTVVPIPLELALIPYMVARRDKLWTIAAIVTGACLLGALVGYGVGAFFMEGVGQSLVETMGWGEGLESFQQSLDEHGFLAVLSIGITPVPFQSAMLAAGASRYPVHLFLLAAAIARGLRYFGLALLVHQAGDRAEALWERHSRKLGVAGAVVALGLVGWMVLR